jgi:hypothetical protein
MTKNKKNKSKSANQKTVSKAARALGFKNIKEAKSFLNTKKASEKIEEISTPVKDAAYIDSEGFRAVQEELAALMLDPHATDDYIVERTKYLISKHKTQNQTIEGVCCSSECKNSPNTEEIKNMKLFVVPTLRGWYDNYTVTVSI